jgi:hypothetical protein
MLSHKNVQMSRAAYLFLANSIQALVADVARGKYVDLHAAVKAECERLEAAPEWVQQLTSTTQSYEDAVSNGFAEVNVIEGFLAALHGFYKKLLFNCDPEASEPVKVEDAWPQLAHDVADGMLAFAAAGAFKLSNVPDMTPEAPCISDEVLEALNNGG